MDKDLSGSQLILQTPTSRFPLHPGSVDIEAPKNSAGREIRTFASLEEAFEAFDSLAEHDGKMEFILKSSLGCAIPAPSFVPETVMNPTLPPLPTESEKHDHLLKNALLLIDAGEYRLARNVLGDVLRHDNNSIEAVRWMGWCFKQEEDFENARKCYEQLINLRVNEQDLFELGEIYYSLKRDTDAQTVWLDALGQCDAESPRLFDLHKNLGNVYTRLADYDSAEENYNKALVLRPNSDVLQVNLGSLNFQKRFYRTALEAFKRAVEFNPFNDRGWCGVALVAREMKDDEWAKAVLLKSLDINPFNLTALQVLINWAQVDSRWSDAIERVEKYVGRFQDDGDMIYALAGLHFQNGDLVSADMELTRLEALDPARGDVRELRNLIEKSEMKL